MHNKQERNGGMNEDDRDDGARADGWVCMCIVQFSGGNHFPQLLSPKYLPGAVK